MKTPHGQAVRRLLTAGTLLSMWICLFAGDPPGAAELNRFGTRYLNNGEVAKALEQFQAAAKLTPADPAIQFNIGLALFRLSRYREALAPLAASLAHGPTVREARYLRGIAFFQLVQFEACIRELERVRGDTRFSEHALYMLVESYRNIHDAKRSREAFVELGNRYPDSAFLNKLMGVAYDWQGDNAKAIEEFQQALRKNPRMPEMAFAIGYSYFKQRKYEEARPWFQRELDLDPCYSKAHYYLGQIEFAQERREVAGARYRKAIECDPQYGDAYVGLGTVLEKRGEIDGAVKAYRGAVRLKPNDRGAHYRLGVLLRRIGRQAESNAEFAIAKKLMDDESSNAGLPARVPEPRP